MLGSHDRASLADCVRKGRLEILHRLRNLWLQQRAVLLGMLFRFVVVHNHPHDVLQAFLPETKGIPLEEIDAYFDSVPIFVPGSKVQVPDANAREEELRQGRVIVDGHEEDVRIDDDIKLEKA